MDDQTTRNNISNAWRLHREGNSDAAIDGFLSVLAGDAEDIDALYGIGLAYKAIGQTDRAVESFTVAKGALEESEKARLAEEKPDDEGMLSLRDPIAGEGDYYLMLSRMINQRLTELEAARA